MSALAAVKPATVDGRMERITTLVDAMLAKKGRTAVAVEQDLRDAGLSSLDTVNLMLAVEGEFDLFIPQGEMTPENFRSVDSIGRLIARLV